MKYGILIGISFLIYGFYGFYVSQVDLTATKEQLALNSKSLFYDYKGVMNVHSIRSTGSGTPESVIEEAKLAGLDFLVLTEVNDFPRPVQLEGYHGKLLVFVGGEYSFLDSRIIYLSLNRAKTYSSMGAMQLHLTDLLSRSKPELKDELLILTSPYQGRYTWSGPYPPGLDGIEVVNLKEMYQRAWTSSPVSFLWSFVVLPFNVQYAFLRLFNPPDAELQLWNKLNQGDQFSYGYLGNDSTAKAIPFQKTNIRFPSHERSFLTASNHLLLRSELTGNAAKDREKIFRALKNGQFYMSIDLLADPKGFEAYVKRGSQIFPLGSRTQLKPGMQLVAQLPREPRYYYEIVVFRNGERVATTNEKEISYSIQEPGSYRVIVRVIPTYPIPDGKKWLTWIYANPFTITK